MKPATAKRLRRVRMGLQTLLGLGRRGVFIPYRYAATIPTPAGYPELEVLFDAARGEFGAVLDRIEAHAETLHALSGPPPRPRFDQAWFAPLDAAAAFVLVRDAPPNKVVEVGSGHSTRFLAAALDGMAGAEHIAIDPAPRAALRGLNVAWREGVLDESHLPLFAALGPGDVAFFDSSHILTPGCDVDLILNRILPALASGVRVHIHDVFLPDPYPAEWEWRGYAEHNALSGWLRHCRLLFASAYAASRMGALERPFFQRLGPARGPASSLWLEIP